MLIKPCGSHLFDLAKSKLVYSITSSCVLCVGWARGAQVAANMRSIGKSFRLHSEKNLSSKTIEQPLDPWQHKEKGPHKFYWHPIKYLEPNFAFINDWNDINVGESTHLFHSSYEIKLLINLTQIYTILRPQKQPT